MNTALANYWSLGAAERSFRGVEADHPAVRGVFDWRLDWDAQAGYPFARTLAPIVNG